MTWQEDEPGSLNRMPLLLEVSKLVLKEFTEEGHMLGDWEGQITGSTIRHMFKRLLARGLLNELGVQQIKLELHHYEETPSDHEH